MNKHFLFSVLILSILLISCDKFEDGGYYYNAQKNLQGTWSYRQVTENYIPLDAPVFDSLYRNSTVEFEMDGTVCFENKSINDLLVDKQVAYYSFGVDKSELNITFSIYPRKTVSYTITCLTKNELVVEYFGDNDVSYQLELIKKN